MVTLEIFNAFMKEINSNNSRNYKLKVLEKYKDHSAVRYLLNYIFNPYIVTGISKKKLKKNIEPEKYYAHKTTTDLLNYLDQNNTGRDIDICRIKSFEKFILNDDFELCNLLESIICKNIQLGVDVLSINKIIPNLIPTFNIMLANKYFDKPEIVEGKEFTLTTKIDGGRIIALKHNNIVEFYTRAGQRYEGLVDLEQEMLQKMPNDIALDGEITLLHSEGLNNKEQYKQTMMITRRDGEKHGIRMRVFDIMSYDEFINQESKMIYHDRRELLEKLFSQVELTFFTKLDNLYTGTDTSQIIKILNEQIDNGEEGVMINITDEYYQFKRTNALLKVKKMHDLDLVIDDFEEGNNQNRGKLGAFITHYKGNVVKVGSGISKDLREKIWNNKEDYRGLTIVVQYFEETTNQNGGISLRFPCFVDFRYDK